MLDSLSQLPIEKEVDLPGGVKLTMVLIPPGDFLMGATAEEQAKFLEKAKAANDTWYIDRIPSVFVFDRQGRQVWHFRHAPGARKTHVTEAELTAVLKDLLARPA